MATKKNINQIERKFPPPPPAKPKPKIESLEERIKRESIQQVKDPTLPVIDLVKVEPVDYNPLRNLIFEYISYFDENSLQANINVLVNGVGVGNIWKQDQYIDYDTNTLAPVERYVFTVWAYNDKQKFTISELRDITVAGLKIKIEDEYSKFFEYVKKWDLCF